MNDCTMTERQSPSSEEDRAAHTMTQRRSSSSEDGPFLKELKELFMEHCTRQWQAEFFLESVSPHVLETMSLLDSLENLETGAPPYSGPDLFTSLLHELSSENREKWIHKEVFAVLQNPIMRAKMDHQFDKDLKAVGIPELMGPSVRSVEKARALVNYQISFSMQKLGQPMGIGDQKAFLVTLTTLIGGHGGLPKESNLYFEYRTTFPVFIAMLRDATKLSTIPPMDFDEKGSARRELSFDLGSNNTSQTSCTYNGRNGRDVRVRISDNESERSRGSSSGARSLRDVRVLKDSPSPLPNHRNNNACGYTIAEGPWLYRFRYNGQSGNDTAYVEIKDEQAYKMMVNKLQGVISKDPSSKFRVTLIHSMDRIAVQRWREKEREDERAEQYFRETCRRELADAFVNAADETFYEDNVGESYMEWFKRDIARQKQQQQQQNLQGEK